MSDYIISTDSTADLSDTFVRENNLVLQYLSFSFGGDAYKSFDDIPMKDFYDRLRNGEVAKTNATVPGIVRDSFEEILKSGKDILQISFSSALSASYSVEVMVANELAEEYPDRKIIVIDSLSAAPGQGLFTYYALKNKEKGMNLEENVKALLALRLHVCHEFTVENLKYLARGGRISKTTAFIGNVIDLKPVLHVDDQGRLINIGKARGRKQSLNALVDNMAKHVSEDIDNPMIFIGHGDCLEDAEYVKEKVRERFGYENFMIMPVGATIGAHSGPGTLALFYLGKER